MGEVEVEYIRARCGRVKTLEPPADVVRWLRSYGGVNRFGDPNYRLVWSGNATTYRTKQWVEKDDHGNFVRRVYDSRECLKYTHPSVEERFVLEAWRDPLDIDFGDRAAWRKKYTKFENGRLVEPLGDFPSRGDYQLCGVVLGLDGESFAWPEPEYLQNDIDLHRYVKNILTPEQAERIAIQAQEREEEAEVDAVYDRIRDNMVFNRNPYVSMMNLAHQRR